MALVEDDSGGLPDIPKSLQPVGHFNNLGRDTIPVIKLYSMLHSLVLFSIRSILMLQFVELDCSSGGWRLKTNAGFHQPSAENLMSECPSV